ncbi:hypothetical protein ACFYE2_00525 [Kocuria sp. CPCC 205300]|uniref:terminase small subunit n=1 Tax=Kocuria sabuli TaxID=3071448 RepID=UPI0036DF590B
MTGSDVAPEEEKGPRAEFGSLSDAVNDAVQHVDLADEDSGVVSLARHYASTIDGMTRMGVQNKDAQMLGKAAYLGPHLLGVLREMGATSAARAELQAKLAKVQAPAPEKKTDPAQAVMDEVGARRRTRRKSSA